MTTMRLDKVAHMKLIVIASIRNFGAYYVGGLWNKTSESSKVSELAVNSLMEEGIIRRERTKDITAWGQLYEAYVGHIGVDLKEVLVGFSKLVYGESYQ